MGGGGFTMEPDNPALDDFVLSLAERREPRILFLPTASGDPDGADRRLPRTLRRPRLPRDAPVAVPPPRRRRARSREIVLAHDVVYVGGGSMRNLLAIWRAHGLDELLVEAWQRGIVLAGLSAGAMCWFAGGITKSGGPPEPIGGPGPPARLAHRARRRRARAPAGRGWTAVRDGALPGGWAADDGVGLLFRGTALARVVSSRPGAAALRVDAVGGELVRHRVEPELLGAAARPAAGARRRPRAARAAPGHATRLSRPRARGSYFSSAERLARAAGAR